jgi:hypothetical protein
MSIRGIYMLFAVFFTLLGIVSGWWLHRLTVEWIYEINEEQDFRQKSTYLEDLLSHGYWKYL